MNAEQYKRATNNSFYVCVVILVSGLVLTIIKLFSAGVTPGRIAIIIAAGIGGAMAANGTSGFLGALVAGFFAGYTCLFLKKMLFKIK